MPAVSGVAEPLRQQKYINRECHASHGPQNPEHLIPPLCSRVSPGRIQRRNQPASQKPDGRMIAQHTDNGNQF